MFRSLLWSFSHHYMSISLTVTLTINIFCCLAVSLSLSISHSFSHFHCRLLLYSFSLAHFHSHFLEKNYLNVLFGFTLTAFILLYSTSHYPSMPLFFFSLLLVTKIVDEIVLVEKIEQSHFMQNR